ncbi:hypothetical protein [Leptospira ilyithenensis]|uniref:Uncharacterized protein n=1 Tax=Leptospira ilyithenensis TaxID=2484901 RepID=A0A4R9LKA1_9LEPT|nr:hypothetical protein [Leptospira ilyithenensis]TGN07952.1 hypothetical protein EHS11_13505 [Leptospira ilyithenensis]
MFTGHYAPAFVLRRFLPKLGFFHLFFAAQFLDYLFMFFLLFGVEKMRIVEGFTESNPFDLYYMPFSHSLVMSLIWSVLVFLIYSGFVFRKEIGRDRILLGLVMGFCVFSHFLLDLPMHREDLPLYSDDSLKLGFGIWKYKYIALALENGLILLSVYFYARALTNESKKKIYLLALILILMNVGFLFFPIPSATWEISIQALLSYIALNGYAYYLDRKIEYL